MSQQPTKKDNNEKNNTICITSRYQYQMVDAVITKLVIALWAHKIQKLWVPCVVKCRLPASMMQIACFGSEDKEMEVGHASLAHYDNRFIGQPVESNKHHDDPLKHAMFYAAPITQSLFEYAQVILKHGRFTFPFDITGETGNHWCAYSQRDVNEMINAVERAQKTPKPQIPVRFDTSIVTNYKSNVDLSSVRIASVTVSTENYENDDMANTISRNRRPNPRANRRPCLTSRQRYAPIGKPVQDNTPPPHSFSVPLWSLPHHQNMTDQAQHAHWEDVQSETRSHAKTRALLSCSRQNHNQLQLHINELQNEMQHRLRNHTSMVAAYNILRETHTETLRLATAAAQQTKLHKEQNICYPNGNFRPNLLTCANNAVQPTSSDNVLQSTSRNNIPAADLPADSDNPQNDDNNIQTNDFMQSASEGNEQNQQNQQDQPNDSNRSESEGNNDETRPFERRHSSSTDISHPASANDIDTSESLSVDDGIGPYTRQGWDAKMQWKNAHDDDTQPENDFSTAHHWVNLRVHYQGYRATVLSVSSCTRYVLIYRENYCEIRTATINVNRITERQFDATDNPSVLLEMVPNAPLANYTLAIHQHTMRNQHNDVDRLYVGLQDLANESNNNNNNNQQPDESKHDVTDEITIRQHFDDLPKSDALIENAPINTDNNLPAPRLMINAGSQYTGNNALQSNIDHLPPNPACLRVILNNFSDHIAFNSMDLSQIHRIQQIQNFPPFLQQCNQNDLADFTNAILNPAIPAQQPSANHDNHCSEHHGHEIEQKSDYIGPENDAPPLQRTFGRGAEYDSYIMNLARSVYCIPDNDRVNQTTKHLTEVEHDWYTNVRNHIPQNMYTENRIMKNLMDNGLANTVKHKFVDWKNKTFPGIRTNDVIIEQFREWYLQPNHQIVSDIIETNMRRIVLDFRNVSEATRILCSLRLRAANRKVMVAKLEQQLCEMRLQQMSTNLYNSSSQDNDSPPQKRPVGKLPPRKKRKRGRRRNRNNRNNNSNSQQNDINCPKFKTKNLAKLVANVQPDIQDEESGK